MIINLEHDYQPGSHWTGLRRCKNTLLHFDSLGFPPDQPIMDYAKRHKLRILFKLIRVQQDDSFYCGHNSLYFLSLVTIPKDVDGFYKRFRTGQTNKDLKSNDELMKSIVSKW